VVIHLNGIGNPGVLEHRRELEQCISFIFSVILDLSSVDHDVDVTVQSINIRFLDIPCIDADPQGRHSPEATLPNILTEHLGKRRLMTRSTQEKTCRRAVSSSAVGRM
jgi:hypothetical protein